MPFARCLVSIAVCSSLVAGVSSPAWADAPIVVGPIHEEGSAFLADCGDFDIIDNYSVNL